MADTDVEFIGRELGQHGSNIYFREFSVRVDGKVKNYKLGKFYVVRRNPTQPICIAEFQLIWKNIKDGRKLASAKLYFRPEDTPHGRQSEHGEDELLEADRHVPIYCSQVPLWECDVQDWCTGRFAYQDVDASLRGQFLDLPGTPTTNSTVEQPKKTKSVKILGFPGYCRYKTCVKILQCGYEMPKKVMLAKGALELTSPETRIVFSRCKFSHPSIEDYVFTGDLKLPVFKGRPRKRKPSGISSALNGRRIKGIRLDSNTSDGLLIGDDDGIGNPHFGLNGANIRSPYLAAEKSHMSMDVDQNPDTFLDDLQTFMKQLGTPILKIPKVAFTRVSLFKLFHVVNSYGGYAQVTMNHKWKRVYDAMGLATTITSAATCIRRHYERLLLPYEKFLRHRHKMSKEQAPKLKSESATEAGVVIKALPKKSIGDLVPPVMTGAKTPDIKVELKTEEDQWLNSSNKRAVHCLSQVNSDSPLRTQFDIRRHDHPRQDLNNIGGLVKKEHELNGNFPKVENSRVGLGTENDSAPALPLKLVIQRRRGRPPKYLKAKLEELKSLAQKAKIGQLCQRPSKRGRKPKSTVLRISVGPDGTISSDLGNLQLPAEERKDMTSNMNSTNTSIKCESKKDQRLLPAHNQVSVSPAVVDGSRFHIIPNTNSHKDGGTHTVKCSSEGTLLFNGYRPSQRKCQLDSLLPKIEQSYLKSQSSAGLRDSRISLAPLQKHQHVHEVNRGTKNEQPVAHFHLRTDIKEGESYRGKSTGKSLSPVVTRHVSMEHSVIINSQPHIIANNIKLEGDNINRSTPLSVPRTCTLISGGGGSQSGKKVGPPPLVPIENNTPENRAHSVACTGKDHTGKNHSENAMSTNSSKIPTAISIASVVPGLNIVSTPFDVESLMKPLTRQIDQSLQNIKETVDAKISGVIYVGDEDKVAAEQGKSDASTGTDSTYKPVSVNESTFDTSRNRHAKILNDVVLKDRGYYTTPRQVLFIPKEHQKGFVVQSVDSFGNASSVKIDKDNILVAPKLHYAVERSSMANASCSVVPSAVLSSYLHNSHYSSRGSSPGENPSQGSRPPKHSSTTITSTLDVPSSQCSCHSCHTPTSHHHYHQHQHHHGRHHQTHYYHRHPRHYHSSEGKVATTSSPSMDSLLRKAQASTGHRCSTVTTSVTGKLIEYRPIEH